MIRLVPGFVIASFVILAAVSTAAQPAAPLKIVVLAGEDSVNVIQQKTAVAPLVEVRDRNDNPVSGAIVTFAVQGGRSAAFQGGAAAMTVATNAAGQAVATGFTPLAAGTVNITVEAAFQGQLAAAAISQVNVMTAAEAAAAAGGAGGGAGSGAGAAGGGAAGGGGGLSATTIGIIGGAAAAGVVAATQMPGGGGGTGYSGPFAIDATSSYPNCAVQRRFGGTLEVDIEDHDSSTAPITGTARIVDAYEEVTSTTCAGPVIGRLNWGMPDAPVTGTEAALSFQAQDAVRDINNSGTFARVYRFTGSLSGPAISGTFELSWRHDVAANSFAGRQSVTLQKR